MSAIANGPITDRIRPAVPSCADAALAYAARGWRVFPLHTIRDGACTCGRETCRTPAKHPRTKHGLKEATTDESQIRSWWTRWPDANLGIATGDGLVVLDVDPRHGGDQSVRKLPHYPFETPIVRTGSGGQHFYFRTDGVVRNATSFRGLAGVEVRGDGG